MIGVIGCGNMAQAIVKGFYQSNKSEIVTYTPTKTRAKELAEAVNGTVAESLISFEKADVIIIACKPQQLDQLVEEIEVQGAKLQSKHIISILAATSIKTLQEKLKTKFVSRVMPNTPAIFGEGMSLLIHADEVYASQSSFVESFFKSCGKVSVMPSEKVFDQVTTVSGSGPAYVFLFAKYMSDQLISWGIDKSEAYLIATQLFLGSSYLMVKGKNTDLDDLISKVTSKGGVTIEAVNHFKENGLEKLTQDALAMAYKRSLEISKDFE